MTAAAEILASLSALGARIERRGERLMLCTDNRPVPPSLIEAARAAKPALLSLLEEAKDWQARHREAKAHWRVLHPASEAEAIAWGEMQNRWHLAHGKRVPRHTCVGCGAPIGDGATLDLIDGNRVHFDTFNCLIRYGERWRGAASRALAAMGFRPPAGVEFP